MEQTKKASKPIEIPRVYNVVSETANFLDQMVAKNWTEKQVRSYLESYAFRKDTVERLVKAFVLRSNGALKEDTGEYPTDSNGNHIHSQTRIKKKQSSISSRKSNSNQVEGPLTAPTEEGYICEKCAAKVKKFWKVSGTVLCENCYKLEVKKQ